jgi:hypothetical protein
MRRIFINYIYKQKCVEMRRERIQKRSTVLFAVVALSAVTLILASQHVSAAVYHKAAVHQKAHTASSQVSTAVASNVHHKVIPVIPEVHGKPLNATALKKLVKGPYGESDVIGGMMSGGY